MKKILSTALVLIMAVGLLAGCGGGTTTTPSASTAPSASASPSTAPSATPSTAPSAVAGETIKIGVLGPLTGGRRSVRHRGIPRRAVVY